MLSSPAPNSHKDSAPRHFIVMDVDSTLIDEEVIDLIAQKAGVGQQIAQITEAAMQGKLDFREALAQRVSMLKGLPVSIFPEILEQVHFTKGALELIRAAHARGWKVGIVSGGFHEITDTLVERASIDYSLANRLEAKDGILTGRLSGPVVDKDAKLSALTSWVHELGLELSDAVSIGDGANDIPTLKAAGIGIAFCAKPLVRQAADAQLDKRDLMQVLPIIDSFESTK